MVCVSLKLNKLKEQDWSSRKYRSAWKLTLLFTLMTVVPAVVSLLLTLLMDNGKEYAFTVLPIDWYVPLIGMLWGAYFGANVIEKHISFVPKKFVITSFEDEGNDNGGQPEGSDNF